MSVTVGLFVERVSVSTDCRPTLALGFVSAIDGPGDGDAVCVTCPTTHQKWKVDRALPWFNNLWATWEGMIDSAPNAT